MRSKHPNSSETYKRMMKVRKDRELDRVALKLAQKKMKEDESIRRLS